MKGWEIKGNGVLREGKTVAVLKDRGEVEYTEGMEKYRATAVRYLRGEGYLAPPGKAPEAAQKAPGVKVEVSATTVGESPPEKTSKVVVHCDEDEVVEVRPKTSLEKVMEGKRHLEEIQPVEPEAREFPLPRGVKLLNPPPEVCFPGHRSTLLFGKNGFNRSLGLDYVPNNEQILTIIRKFRTPQ